MGTPLRLTFQGMHPVAGKVVRQARRSAGASEFGAPADVRVRDNSVGDNPRLAVNRAGTAVLTVAMATSDQHNWVRAYIATAS